MSAFNSRINKTQHPDQTLKIHKRPQKNLFQLSTDRYMSSYIDIIQKDFTETNLEEFNKNDELECWWQAIYSMGHISSCTVLCATKRMANIQTSISVKLSFIRTFDFIHHKIRHAFIKSQYRTIACILSLSKELIRTDGDRDIRQ